MSLAAVDPTGFEFALGKIADGFLFENFALDFLSKFLGYSFIPAGGLQDRGIDGFEQTSVRKDDERFIYQTSIQAYYLAKINDSLEKLKKNKIRADKFFYVTNQHVKDKDRLADELQEKWRIPVVIWDVDWFKYHVNDSEQTITAYNIWIESNLHEYSKPGKSFEITDLGGDPRLYVFLRQQVDNYGSTEPMDQILVDTLILFALEGTDPDKGILRRRDEIIVRVNASVQFDPAVLHNLIDHRLRALSSSRPRRINHHKREDSYCLPYETRLEIQNRNLADAALFESFRSTVTLRLAEYLKGQNVDPEVAYGLIEEALHSLFRQQGLEFAEFVLNGECEHSIEKSLPLIISEVVDRSPEVKRNQTLVKRALVTVLRELVYRGSPDTVDFLRRLSRTYTMLFLIQCDPQLSVYFSSMAAKLNVYVDNSILVPALSEFYLEPHNRRHWNLLTNARDSGVGLVINQTTAGELAAHFRHVREVYQAEYSGKEDIYAEEFIDEILIRAYFYARLRGQAHSFDEFLDNFANVRSPNLEQQLIEWLQYDFGIKFIPDANLDVAVNLRDLQKLTQALVPFKGSRDQAENDARLVLMLHALREKRNESGDGGIFGYRTWWLSKDTTTERAVRGAFGDRFPTSCYMRPDFLYNYISLAPSKAAVDKAFSALLPTLVGVSLAYHLPHQVNDVVHKFVREHQDKNPARLKGAIRDLSDYLKTGAFEPTREMVAAFLSKKDAELRR